MGQRSVYLVLIPRISGHLTARQRATFERSFDQLEIRADHRAVALARYTGSVAELGIGDPALLPIAGWPRLYYPIERVDLDAIAAANRFELRAVGLSTPQLYEEWSGRRHVLVDFVRQLPHGSARTSAHDSGHNSAQSSPQTPSPVRQGAAP